MVTFIYSNTVQLGDYVDVVTFEHRTTVQRGHFRVDVVIFEKGNTVQLVDYVFPNQDYQNW